MTHQRIRPRLTRSVASTSDRPLRTKPLSIILVRTAVVAVLVTLFGISSMVIAQGELANQSILYGK
jgi:hypothetical protein